MLSPTRIGLAMLSCQRLTGEVRQHLPGRALLPPRPLLNSEEDVIIQANCGAHARDANAYSGTPILEPAAVAWNDELHDRWSSGREPRWPVTDEGSR